MSHDEHGNPIVQGLDLLLTGYGYNYYNEKNKMRADDLLVRHRAAESLGHAANMLASLQGEYQRRFVPPGTRDQPFPPPERMEHLREIADARERLSALAGEIRSMPVPAQDRTWWRMRGERATLESLLQFDKALVGEAAILDEAVTGMIADAWLTGDLYRGLLARIEALARVTRERKQLLQMPA